MRAMPATQRMEGVGNVFSKISELLGFMSALVVDREKWQSIIREGSARGYENYYVQVYVVGRIIERYGSWGIVQEPCVRFRTSNDQLLGKFGWRKRLEIDVIAYDQTRCRHPSRGSRPSAVRRRDSCLQLSFCFAATEACRRIGRKPYPRCSHQSG